MGRALDLASAYRRLAISDNSKCDAYLSVYSPAGGRAELFRQVALPFGSRTAVNALIHRVRFCSGWQRDVWKTPVSCYFDDFVFLTYPALPSNTQEAMCLMLDILGRKFDCEGDSGLCGKHHRKRQDGQEASPCFEGPFWLSAAGILLAVWGESPCRI